MMCAKFGTIVMANNDLARGGGGTYETPYTLKPLINRGTLLQGWMFVKVHILTKSLVMKKTKFDNKRKQRNGMSFFIPISIKL